MGEKPIGKKITNFISRILMICVALIQLFDFIFTSISIQDFLGTGNTFKWVPIEAFAHVYGDASPSQTYCYDNADYHYKDALTKWGYRMLEQVATNPKDYLWASIGYFDSSRHPEMDMCNYFTGNYSDIEPSRARFMSTKEKLTLVKPLSVDEVTQPKVMKMNEKDKLLYMDGMISSGYYGSRRGVEIRMTARLDFNYTQNKKLEIENGSWKGYWRVTKPVKAVRFYGKSFCDGCMPIAELGQMFCELECKVTDGRNKSVINVEVYNSHRRHLTQHRMGVSFPNTSASFYESVIRVLIMIYVCHIMFNILPYAVKSNEERYSIYDKQCSDATVLTSTLIYRPKILELLYPEKNVCKVQSFSISFVLYNSDIIIYLNLIVVAMTFMTSMQLKHEVVWWAYHHETFRAVITRIGVNAKMMWLYVAMIKLYKNIFARLGLTQITEKICFNSQLFVWFWAIYLIFLTWTGLDFLLDPLFKNRVDIINDFVLMNDISVRFQYGFYFIRIPSVALHTIFVSGLGLLLLIILQDASGSAKRSNSLFREMACGHAILIYDSFIFMDDIQSNISLIDIGLLMNLKWFLKTHVQSYTFIGEYGIFNGPTSIEFKDNIHYVSKKKDNKTDQSSDVVNASIMRGENGALQIIERLRKEGIESNPSFHDFLSTGKIIRIQ